jgi:hypothetical protein
VLEEEPDSESSVVTPIESESVVEVEPVVRVVLELELVEVPNVEFVVPEVSGSVSWEDPKSGFARVHPGRQTAALNTTDVHRITALRCHGPRRQESREFGGQRTTSSSLST